jgi:hypothetical protein
MTRQQLITGLSLAATRKKLSNLSFATQNKVQALAQWRAAPPTVEKAGILARVQALHEYTSHNTAALVAWILFFTLVLFFELMVVLSKLVFRETVDDELDRIRESISQQRRGAIWKP